MIVALELPPTLAAAIALEAGREGVSVPTWILERLNLRFGLHHVATASRVPVIVSETDLDCEDIG